MAFDWLDTTTTSTGNEYYGANNRYTQTQVQAKVSGTGSVSATVVIECSTDGLDWVTLGTITLSGTTSATDGFAAVAWPHMRPKVTAISGTGARVISSVTFA